MATKSPRYEQIAEDLRRRIESGEFPPGSPLPSELELRETYQTSRNTVREAIKLLTTRHLAEPRLGLGIFVVEEIEPLVTTLSTDPQVRLHGGEESATYPTGTGQAGRRPGTKAPEVAVLKCPPEIARQLRINDSKRVVSRRQVRYIEDEVWSVQTSYYPLEWVQRGAAGLLEPEDIPEGTVGYLAATIGLKQVGYRDQISVRLADEQEQALFNLNHHHTMLEVCRTSYAEDWTPIRATVTAYPSGRNQIVYEIGDVPGR